MKMRFIILVIPFLICTKGMSADTLYKYVRNKMTITVDSVVYTVGLIELKENSIRIVDKKNIISEIPVESINSFSIINKGRMANSIGWGYAITYVISNIVGYIMIFAGDMDEVDQAVYGLFMPFITFPIGIAGGLIGAVIGAMPTKTYVLNCSDDCYNNSKEYLQKFIRFSPKIRRK